MKKCISCEGLIQDYYEECPFCGKKIFKKWEIVSHKEKKVTNSNKRPDNSIIDYTYDDLRDVVSNGG